MIVVSAYGDKRTRQEAARRGANDFFQKPFSFPRLHRRMRLLVATAPDQLPGCQDEDLLMAKQRRLAKLRERQALLGINAPVELEIEIEDLKEELNNSRSERR